MSPAEPLSLRCIGLRVETPTIKTFVFLLSAPVTHEAGQAVMLGLPGPEGLLWPRTVWAAPKPASASSRSTSRSAAGASASRRPTNACGVLPAPGQAVRS